MAQSAYILLRLLLVLLLLPLALFHRLHLPADWARACGRGVESCIVVLDNGWNTRQCVDKYLLNHRAVVSIVAMHLIRELNRPAPMAAARPTAQLQ